MLAADLLKTTNHAGGHARIMGGLAIVLLGLIAIAVTLGVESRRMNEAQLRAEHNALTDALTLRLLEQSRDLSQMASASAPAGRGAAPFERLLSIAVSTKKGGQASTNPSDMELARRIAERLRGGYWDRAARADVTGAVNVAEPGENAGDAQGFVALDGALYAATVAPGKASTGDGVIGLRRVDPAYLSGLASQSDVQGLELVAADSVEADRAAVPLTLPAAKSGEGHEDTGAWLAWQPRRPGDLLLLGYGLWLLGLTIIVAGLLIWQAHRTVRHLRESEAQARKLAWFDPLSGLPNRFVFGQFVDAEFARAARGGGEPFAYLSLDIDHLREINDTFGHEAGDRLIAGVAERITSCLQAGERLGRMHGDEFAILQTGIAGPRECADLAARIFEALKEPLDLSHLQLGPRLSIGIALHPNDAANREDLMLCADQALERAKGEGRNRYSFFEKKIGDDIRLRKTTEAELRSAIKSDGLCVLYQPIMTIDGSRLSSVEALVRWNHPQRGLVPPDHFIQLAEDRGLILELGEWVLRRACRDGRQWPGLRVAVNVSPIQFRQKNFAQIVENVVKEEGFDPSQLELELTEGVVIADAEQAENVMMDLRALGVRLALDDFGTGYSSLVYLRRFAFDKIKIDRSFLESMESTGESAIIVHSIIHLGRSLGLTVTAEGIETTEQHRFLQAAGAHELQGYLFSRPVPAEKITEMLDHYGQGRQRAVA